MSVILRYLEYSHSAFQNKYQNHFLFAKKLFVELHNPKPSFWPNCQMDSYKSKVTIPCISARWAVCLEPEQCCGGWRGAWTPHAVIHFQQKTITILKKKSNTAMQWDEFACTTQYSSPNEDFISTMLSVLATLTIGHVKYTVSLEAVSHLV